MSNLAGKHLLLIISGGIAAYKTLELIRRLRERGVRITAVMTEAAKQFVTPLSVASLTGEKVYDELFSLTDETEMGHIQLSRAADVILVAPATADLMAKAAHGLANDLASTLLLAADRAPIFAPAMNVRMWVHSATRRNVELLRQAGCKILGPADGEMACGEFGPGRMIEPLEIVAQLESLTADGVLPKIDLPEGRSSKPLAGRRAIVTAGPTREAIDPVRYISNKSSGKQGYAIAARAAARGARVRLLSANVALADPAGVLVTRVESALDLARDVSARVEEADVVVMAAAVADFRPAAYAQTKIKKTHDPGDPDAAPVIELLRNPDILAGLVRQRGAARTPVIVGFAAETGDADHDVLALGREKLARKGCDLLVVNEVGADKTFGQDDNTVHLLRPDSDIVVDVGPAPKSVIADAVLDAVRDLVDASPDTRGL